MLDFLFCLILLSVFLDLLLISIDKSDDTGRHWKL